MAISRRYAFYEFDDPPIMTRRDPSWYISYAPSRVISPFDPSYTPVVRSGNRLLILPSIPKRKDVKAKGELIFIAPGFGKGQTFHHGIPRIAHQRITETAAPPHHYRHTYLPREYDPVLPLVPSRPYTSAFLDELDHNPRISLLEDQLTRMRHDTAALSDRLHGRPAPGARPRVTAGYSSYSPAEYTPPPRRPRNYLLEMPENVYTAVIRPLKCVMNDVYTMAHYYTMPKMPPPNRPGVSHLSCVAYSRSVPINRRCGKMHDEETFDYLDRMRRAHSTLPVRDARTLEPNLASH